VSSEPVSLRALVSERDWGTLWLGAEGESSHGAVVGRAAMWVVVLVLSVRFATHGPATNFAGDSFLHLINLVFHEAGHILFSWGGALITALGGSLTQILVPLVCAVALRRYDDVFGASVGVWWVGQNLVDLAPYINDARALQLVLLGDSCCSAAVPGPRSRGTTGSSSCSRSACCTGTTPSAAWPTSPDRC
jgi:hypothetical protein